MKTKNSFLYENTYRDLSSCLEFMDNDDISDSEKEYREKLIQLCIRISSEHHWKNLPEYRKNILKEKREWAED